MDAFIYDHVRTPRGRGKTDGSLHDIPAVQLSTQVLQALRDRNALDASLVDDVILNCAQHCAQPVGEQGGNVARASVVSAGYAQTVAGQQAHRFCASGLEADRGGTGMQPGYPIRRPAGMALGNKLSNGKYV